ncbi:MAG: ribosome small subunit-dependent GTPase A [Firmicutes bacterium]|nr:ribosome small subunit-dependent GTPase A [Candidatus Colimorpha enterica]
MVKKGKIILGVGGIYTVYTSDGEYLSCPAKGSFRHASTSPCVGDDVTVSCEDGNRIETIDERRNILIRPHVSNVGTMFVTFAAARPEPVLLNTDKLTCIAEHLGIKPVIIVTKADVSPEKAEEIASIYRAVGYDVFVLGNGIGSVDCVREYVKTSCRDGVTCFAGASGVGKTTLMTRLFPNLELETGELSRKIERGKNTTRKVELFPLDTLFCDGKGGFIADTPGFSLLDFIRFDFLDKEVLPNNFPEFGEYIGRCRYTKCTHLCEEGCAVVAALEEGKIPRSRHDSYVAIYGELKNKHSWENKNGKGI